MTHAAAVGVLRGGMRLLSGIHMTHTAHISIAPLPLRIRGAGGPLYLRVGGGHKAQRLVSMRKDTTLGYTSAPRCRHVFRPTAPQAPGGRSASPLVGRRGLGPAACSGEEQCRPCAACTQPFVELFVSARF